MNETVYDKVVAKAKELGAAIPANQGINWIWAFGFPNTESAQKFIDFLDSIKWEHRGVYDNPGGTADVRYRG